MKEIFLIEELQVDSMVKQRKSGQYTYLPKGWVEDEDKAKEIVDKGKTYLIGLTSASLPQFKYKKLVKHDSA
jgi:hypothetical protein